MRQFFLLLLAAAIAADLPAQTWSSRTSGTGVYLRSVAFVDASTAYVVGGDSYASRTIRKSTDGGATWTAQSTPSDAYAFQAVAFTDANNGTAVGDIGTIVRTANGGTTWTFQYNTAYDNYQTLYAVSFASASNGITVGVSGRILYTTNSGTNWNVPSTNPTGEYLYGVDMADVNTAVAVGASGTIIRTTDGGANWTSVTSGTGNHLIAVSFAGALIGTAVGFNGTILRTTDAGATWTDQSSGTAALRGVCFTDANNGTAVGDAGTIKRTVDGGAHWTNQTSGVSTTLTGVSFIDANVGLAVGSGGTIRGTNDGGLPVELTAFTAAVHGKKVLLQWTTATETNNLGFEVERTKVSGRGPVEWEGIGFVNGNGTCNAPQAYSFTDAAAAGRMSYRLKQVDRDGRSTYSSVVETFVEGSPVQFTLEQNYPNPFNPSTTIRFGVPVASMVRLTVYDPLGRCVAELMHGTMDAGYREVVWHARAAAGMYFCTIECRSLSATGERFTQTKKLLLTK